MENIARFINRRKTKQCKNWDQKSIFYAFERVIKSEYGNKGLSNFSPEFYKDGKIFIRSGSSAWSNELVLNEKELVKMINAELGQAEIISIKIKK